MEKTILEEIKRVREIMNLNEEEELLNEQAWLKNLFKFGGADAETIGKNLSKDSRESLFTAFKSGDEAAMAAARETLFGHVANQLAAEGVDLRKYLKPSEGGQIQYVFNQQTKQELAGKIKSALGVNDDRAVADFLKDYRLKQGSSAGASATAGSAAQTGFADAGADLGSTAQTLVSDAINPADVTAWVDAIQVRFGKNIPSDVLKRSAQDLAAKLPGATLFEKLNYIETQVPDLDAVFAKRAAISSARNKQMYQSARVLLSDLGSMLRRLPKNPKQFLGMAFQILSGFAVVGAIAGAIKPEEGHSRLYSAMNGVSLGLLSMFNEPTKGVAPKTNTTTTGAPTNTPSGNESFDLNQDPTKGPDQNAATAGDKPTTAATTGGAAPLKKINW